MDNPGSAGRAYLIDGAEEQHGNSPSECGDQAEHRVPLP